MACEQNRVQAPQKNPLFFTKGADDGRESQIGSTKRKGEGRESGRKGNGYL